MNAYFHILLHANKNIEEIFIHTNSARIVPKKSGGFRQLCPEIVLAGELGSGVQMRVIWRNGGSEREVGARNPGTPAIQALQNQDYSAIY